MVLLNYKKNIAQSFSRAAKKYDQAASVQKDAGHQLLQAMSAVVPDASMDVIIDIGCGTGYFIKQLQQYSAQHYIGLDLSPGMLVVAREKYKSLDNTQWLQGDAENIALKKSSVDIIYANFSLQWCKALDALLSGFCRLLKPGGYCCFTTLGQNTLCELRAAWASIDDDIHVNHFFAESDWQQAIIGAGFLVDHHYQHDTRTYAHTARQSLCDLKIIGANYVAEHRSTGLMGKQHFQDFLQSYERCRDSKGIPTSYEIHGWLLHKRP